MRHIQHINVVTIVATSDMNKHDMLNDEDYQKKTPIFMVPIIKNPKIRVEIEAPTPFTWGINIQFVATNSGGYLFPLYPLNDFKTFCKLLDLYDALRKASPSFFETNMPPSEKESELLVNLLKAWLETNGFPVFVNGYEYQTSDHLTAPNLHGCYIVTPEPDKDLYRISISQLMESVRDVVESSEKRKGFFPAEYDSTHFLYGRIELRIINKKIVYYSEDLFAAIRAQLALCPPEKIIVNCAACGESFPADHARQKYCGKPGCDRKTSYNHSAKGQERSKRAKAKQRKEGEPHGTNN